MELKVWPVRRARDENGEEGGFGCAVDLPEEGLGEVLNYPVPGVVAERTYSFHLISLQCMRR